jgi:hypothetical protein
MPGHMILQSTRCRIWDCRGLRRYRCTVGCNMNDDDVNKQYGEEENSHKARLNRKLHMSHYTQHQAQPCNGNPINNSGTTIMGVV